MFGTSPPNRNLRSTNPGPHIRLDSMPTIESPYFSPSAPSPPTLVPVSSPVVFLLLNNARFSTVFANSDCGFPDPNLRPLISLSFFVVGLIIVSEGEM